MDETVMKARLAELEQALETERRNAKSALEKAQAAEARVTELLAEREAAQAELARVTGERDAFEGDLIEAELSALVGKKFHAAELSDMREDRKRLGKEKFAERMARRADLATSATKLGPEPVTPPETLSDHCKKS